MSGLDPAGVISAAQCARELGIQYDVFIRLIKAGKVPRLQYDTKHYAVVRREVWAAPVIRELLTTKLAEQAEILERRRQIAETLRSGDQR